MNCKVIHWATKTKSFKKTGCSSFGRSGRWEWPRALFDNTSDCVPMTHAMQVWDVLCSVFSLEAGKYLWSKNGQNLIWKILLTVLVRSVTERDTKTALLHTESHGRRLLWGEEKWRTFSPDSVPSLTHQNSLGGDSSTFSRYTGDVKPSRGGE